MSKNVISERKRLAAIFVSFSILFMGAASLLQSMSLDYYTVLNTLGKIIPASLIMGALGWVMGMVLDKPRTRKSSGYNNLFLHDVIRKEMTDEESESIGNIEE